MHTHIRLAHTTVTLYTHACMLLHAWHKKFWIALIRINFQCPIKGLLSKEFVVWCVCVCLYSVCMHVRVCVCVRMCDVCCGVCVRESHLDQSSWQASSFLDWWWVNTLAPSRQHWGGIFEFWMWSTRQKVPQVQHVWINRVCFCAPTHNNTWYCK